MTCLTSALQGNLVEREKDACFHWDEAASKIPGKGVAQALGRGIRPPLLLQDGNNEDHTCQRIV